MNDRVILNEQEALALIDDELRRRHAERRGVALLEGVVVLPARTPKPEPPADFWAEGEGPAARVPSVREVATARLLELMRAKRDGKSLN